ncbi:MAG: hypothetical protein QF554_11185 [Dehalococcoidia bacterium]|jgi:hypothetical protein|nr:hypothetical protein [Dehalococcoidia bacterium]
MIRSIRTYTAQPGKTQQLIDTLKEMQAYARTQDVAMRIFVEPWGHGSRVRLSTDHEDAGAGQEWLQRFLSVERAREARDRIEYLIEGHQDASILLEVD